MVEGQVVWLHEFIMDVKEAWEKKNYSYLCSAAEKVYGNGAQLTMEWLIEETYTGFKNSSYNTIPSFRKYALGEGLSHLTNEEIRLEFLARLMEQPNRRIFLPKVEKGD